MKRLVTLLAPLALLAGCSFAPKLVQSTPTTVIVDHRHYPGDFTQALSLANQQCQKYNRSAVLDRQTCPGRCVTQFRCE
jgi:uncharacterized lipoprotein YajG